LLGVKSTKIVNRMIDIHKLHNQKDISLQTPLHIALVEGNCELVEKLLSIKDIVYAQDSDGNNEYHKWVSHECEKCLKLLLTKKDIKFAHINKKGTSCLQTSIMEKKFSKYIKIYIFY